MRNRMTLVALLLTIATTPALANRNEDCENTSGNPKRAIEICTDIINYPNLRSEPFVPGAVASAYGNRGVAKAKLGDHQGAIADYSQSLKLEPSRIVRVNRGLEYLRIGNYDSAMEDANLGLKEPPSKDEPKSGPLDFVGAKPPTEAALTYIRARALEGSGRTKEALNDYQSAYLSARYHNDTLSHQVMIESEKHIRGLGQQPFDPSTAFRDGVTGGMQGNLQPAPAPAPMPPGLPAYINGKPGYITEPPAAASPLRTPDYTAHAAPSTVDPAEMERRCKAMGMPCNVQVVPPEALHDPETDKLWKQFDRQKAAGTLDGPPSKQPLSQEDRKTIEQAKKLQCALRPDLC